MKKLSLLIWVTQFGFSVIVPLCGALLLGNWLGLGFGGMAIFAVLGLVTSIPTARSCLRAMRKETEKETEQPSVAFNDHE